MTADYPAAHSMDSTWFAVDAAGRVVCFSTGSIGHMPEGECHDIREELGALRKPAGEPEENDLENFYNFVPIDAFHYDGEQEPLRPYERCSKAEVPLHIDQLPPPLREACRKVTFPVLLGEAERFQPLEFIPCNGYIPDECDAYICADGKTIKPMPGWEANFPEFVAWFRETQPEEAQKYVFDFPPT